jgi:photosystem II stability/assembly factor-like uncharacterized protein
VEGGIAQWVQQNSGTTQKLTDVVMLDSTTAIAVGRDRAILRTTNAGATWFDVVGIFSYTKPWNGVSFFDTTYGLVVGDNGVVFTTINGGKAWLRHQIPGGQKCLSALHRGYGTMYVGADSGWIYSSVDTGNTWASQKISAWPIRSIFIWRGTAIPGFPIIYALTSNSLCTRDIMPIPFWPEKILPNFQGLGSEAFSGEFCNGGGAGFIVGVQGDLHVAPAIIRKSMSDTMWREVSQNILRDGTLFGVSAPSANVIYVCGSNGMIFKTTNGGDTWTAATVPTTRTLNAIYFYNERLGFAVGDSGTILYTENGGGVTGVGKEPAVPPKEFHLSQNYPNPFNPVTVISYQLAVNSFVTMRVYDLLGREVTILVNEEKPVGSYSVRWNAANFPSGAYFYHLIVGNQQQIGKMSYVK